jgi:hypothetical protein
MPCLAFLLLSVLLAICSPAMAIDPKPSPSFVADSKIQQIAEAYSADAVDFAKSQFGVTLDWSEASIASVERFLAQMHTSYLTTKPRPTEEQVMSFAKAFGSYIGEVYRRSHGGEWGMVTLEGQSFPGLRTRSGVNFWPWGRALNRIMQGPENNVADYYKVLLEREP